MRSVDLVDCLGAGGSLLAFVGAWGAFGIWWAFLGLGVSLVCLSIVAASRRRG